MIMKPFRTGAFRLSLMTLVATAFLAMPAESHAIFHWFSQCCGGGATPTYSAAPLYGAGAPADNCCAPPQVQTVSYVPQTCYRTQYVTVPVTTYRPVVGRDPCTGCPVTCMRPATSYVQQARFIPYTTYRMVMSNPCATAATVRYAPAYAAGMSYAPAASCGGCSGAAPAVNYAAPAAAAPYVGSATSSTIIRSTPTDAAASQPTLPGSNGFGDRTFQQPMQKLQKPIAKPEDDDTNGAADSEASKASGTGGILSPRLFQPNDRTTSYPMLRAGTRPVGYREAAPAAVPQRPINDGGWRPSTR